MTLEQDQERFEPTIGLPQALHAISERIAAGGSADATITAILEIVVSQTQMRYVGVVDQRGRHFEVGSPGAAASEAHAALTAMAAGVREHARVTRAEHATHPVWVNLPPEVASLDILPLRAHGTQQGVLWFARFADPAPVAGFDVFAQTVASQIAIVVATAAAFDTARKQREWLSAILTSTPDPVLVIDQNRCLQLANRAAHDAFAVLDATELGCPLDEIDLPEGLIDLDGNYGWDEMPIVDFTAENGHTYSPRVSFVQTEDGQTSGWVVILRDMTHFKRLNDSMSDFLSTVSHDMRSPLTFMKGYLDMLGMIGSLNERQLEFVEKIAAGFDQMSDMVEKILEAGRLDPMTGNYQLQRELSDMTEVIDKIIARFKEPAAKKGLELAYQIHDDIPILNVDREMVNSAFTNLVENAVKYTPEDGKVAVRLSIQDDELIFQVTDTGFGISEDDQKKLFQRNVRIRRKEWKRVKGNGLGLFIVKNVAQRHGGDAWVVSKEGEGSSFYFSIPLEGPNITTGRTVPDERANASAT